MEEITNVQAPAKAELVRGEAIRLTSHDSTLWGVSIRGWIAIVVVLTVCLMSAFKIEVKEPLYTLAGLIVGFYFGQNPKKSP